MEEFKQGYRIEKAEVQPQQLDVILNMMNALETQSPEAFDEICGEGGWETLTENTYARTEENAIKLKTAIGILQEYTELAASPATPNNKLRLALLNSSFWDAMPDAELPLPLR
jgi:hypothetical protein